jgi:malate dehydrogenase
MKISIIGAGNVGATLANRVLESGLGGVVLVDVMKGIAEGKALDMMHAAPIVGYENTIVGTDDYSRTSNSDIIAITAGFPRKPGMTRSDLTAKNSAVIREVVSKTRELSPASVIIMVTNPLDVMTYLAYKESGFERERVIGMAGVLDSSRFACIISKRLGVPHGEIETIVLGEHGPNMVPIISRTKVSGKPLASILAPKKIDELTKELAECGAKIVELLGTTSAFYAPSAACFAMIKAIARNENRLMSVSCVAQGEYGLDGVSTGLPVRLGKGGISEIAKLDLTKEELDALRKSAGLTKEAIAAL